MAELRERLEHRALLLQLLPERHHQPHQRCHRVLGVRPGLPTPGFSPSPGSLGPLGRAVAVPAACAPWAAWQEGTAAGHGLCWCAVQVRVGWTDRQTASPPLFASLYPIVMNLSSL